jgi:hypothetical protein
MISINSICNRDEAILRGAEKIVLRSLLERSEQIDVMGRRASNRRMLGFLRLLNGASRVIPVTAISGRVRMICDQDRLHRNYAFSCSNRLA